MAETTFVKCRDPRVDLEKNFKKTYALVQPAKEVTYRELPSQTTSTSSQTIVCPPPSTQTCVSRRVMLKADVVFTWPAGTQLSQRHDAPRSFPLQSCINTASVTFNTTQVTVDSTDIIHAMSRFYSLGAPMIKGYSTAPTMEDQFQLYSMGAETVSNPLGSRLDQATDSAPNRGAFPMTYFYDPTNAAATTVTATFCEPLLLSPFSWADDDGLGLYGIQNLTFNFNFGSLARMWSHDASTGVLADPVVTFNRFSMLFTYLTPPLQSVPKVLTYPYYQIQKFISTDNTSRAAGATFTSVPSPVLQLNGCPNCVYIFAQKEKSTLVKEDSDVFLGIQSINQMTLMNETGKLSGATTQQLYNITARNGLSVSYPDFSGLPQPLINNINTNTTPFYVNGCGSILKLEPTDLGLPDLLVAGSMKYVQMQFTLNLYAPVALAGGYTLYAIVVYEGKFDISNLGATVPQVSFVTEKDVLDAQVVDGALATRNSRTLGSGHMGGFDIGSLFDGFKSILPVAKDVLGVVDQAGKLFGSGKPKKKGAGVIGAGVIGAGDSYGDGDGAGSVGGKKMMRRNALAERL